MDTQAADSREPVSDSSQIWSDAARFSISHIPAIPRCPPNTVYTTLDDVTVSQDAFSKAKVDLRAQLENEKAAIARAEQEVFNAFAGSDAAIDEALLALRQQHNLLLPVSRLPPEILAIIFAFLFPAHSPPGWSRKWLCPLYYRRVVTHVCRYWRQVALDQPSLWALIDIAEYVPDCAATMLARARSSTLSLEAFSDELRPQQLEFLVENLARTRILGVKGNDQVFTTLTKSAPLLHTLLLETDETDVPHGFLAGHVPALRHLHITSKDTAIMSWTSPLFTDRITSLEITHQGHMNPTLDHVLDGLVRMCSLEHLRLEVFFVDDDEILAWETSASGQHRLITHAKLVDLVIQSYPRDAMMLFSHLSLRPDAVISCHLGDLPDDLTAFSQIAFASVRSPTESTVDRSRAVTDLNIVASLTRIYRTVTVWTVDDEESKPALSLSFSPRCSMEDLMPSALMAFVSPHLTGLSVTYDYALAWRNLLANASGLECLTARGFTVFSLYEALHPEDTNNEATAELQPHCLVPVLSTLILADIGPEFPDRNRAVTRKVWSTPTPLGDPLSLCLVARAAAGCPLEELDISDCNVEEAWVMKTREALPATEVKWKETAD